MRYKDTVLVSWVLVVFYSDPSNQTQHSVAIDGDILLGGLVPIHAAGQNAPCGPINERLGIQRLEAMLYAVDQVNKNSSLLANVTLGLDVYDTCSSETVALDNTLNFIHGHLSKIDHGTSCKTCHSDRSSVVGVVGAVYSTVSTQVARLLRLFQIPQVSYDSTIYELSDKNRFEYFSRTVPHDLYQAKAIADIARYFNWTYISVVYSDDTYGNQGLQALKAASAKMGICIGALEKVDLSLPRHQYLNVIENLLLETRARCVVIFCSKEQQIANLMFAAKSKGVHQDFQWIGTDAWATIVWLDKLKDVAKNAITVQPRVVRLKEFEDYYYKLKPGQNSRNQWFNEYWENHFQCYLNETKKQFQRKCNESDKLTSGNSQLDMRVASTMDAIFTFAHTLDKLHKIHCPHTKNVCDSLLNISGKELLANLRNVSFVGATGFNVRFDENGDMGGAYEINLFRNKNGKWGNVMIGEWNHGLSIKPSVLQGNSFGFHVIQSHCTPRCGRGYLRVPVKGKESCCWTCERCNGNSYVVNDSLCIECPLGQWPLASGKGCKKIYRSYFGIDYKFSVPAMVFSGLGIIFTLFVISVLIKFNNTPVVKACGRELSHLLLIGIVLCFTGTFITVIKPCNWTCAARLFGDSLPFTLCYAALFIKTNRISRIFNRKNLTRRPVLILPASQLFLVVTVVVVQVLILAILTVLRIPRAKEYYSDNEFVYLDCSISALDFGLSQVYNFILILMCTVYAFKTRNSPSNFNEAKCIAFAMYSSCVVWFAFLAILYMQNTPKYKPVVICVSVSLVAYILLGFLYGSKVYIIVFQPHRNVRKPVATSVSLSSISQSNSRNRRNSYMGFHGDIGDDPESSESILDQKRASCDYNRRSVIAKSVPEEMEKLVSHLKKELHITKQALKSAQDLLNDFEREKSNGVSTNKENRFDAIHEEKSVTKDEKTENVKFNLDDSKEDNSSTKNNFICSFDAIPEEKSGRKNEKTENVKFSLDDNKMENASTKNNLCALHASKYLNHSADFCSTDNSLESSNSGQIECSSKPILGHKDFYTRRSNSLSSIDNPNACSNEGSTFCRCKRAKIAQKHGIIGIPALSKSRGEKARAPRPNSKSRLITNI